jgi:hypothetical protein
MPKLEEVASWTLDQIRAHIHGLLPEGWKFDLQPHTDHWLASYKTPANVEVWSGKHVDQRIILLTAYGWLWQKREPRKTHPAWIPQPTRLLIPVLHPAATVPDPEDLDPQAIQSVYADPHRRKR